MEVFTQFNHKVLDLVWYSVGFGYSLFVGYFLIKYTQKSLHPEYGSKKSDEWLPAVVGLVERFLYLATALAGFPEFVETGRFSKQWAIGKDLSQIITIREEI